MGAVNSHDRVIAKLTPRQRRAIEDQCSSLQGIAEHLGVGRAAVRRAGLQPRKRRGLRDYTSVQPGVGCGGTPAALTAITPEQQAELEATHSSLRALSEATGVAIATLYRHGWVARAPKPSPGFALPRVSAVEPIDQKIKEVLTPLYRKYLRSKPENPTLAGMAEWAARKNIECPAQVTMYWWLKTAGMTPTQFYAMFNIEQTGRAIGRGRATTVEQCLDAVAAFVAAMHAADRPVNSRDYDEWCGDLPSHTTVRATLGMSWRDAILAGAERACVRV